MGFLDEFRKLLFGVRSVTKSTAEKGLEKGQEIGRDLSEKAGTVREKGAELWSSMSEKGKEVTDELQNSTGEWLESAQDFTQQVGEKVLDTGSEFIRKGRDFAEELGSKVLGTEGSQPRSEASVDALFNDSFGHEDPEADRESLKDDIMDKATKVGEHLLEAKKDLARGASALGNKLSQKFDELLERSQEEAAKAASATESAPNPLDQQELLTKSAFDDTDDFFKKAEAFAEGRYQEVRNPGGPLRPTITGKENAPKKEGDFLPGFDDLDGDGNEIIDDAILHEEE